MNHNYLTLEYITGVYTKAGDVPPGLIWPHNDKIDQWDGYSRKPSDSSRPTSSYDLPVEDEDDSKPASDYTIN